MEHIYQSVVQLIGGTPLMEAKAVEEKQQLKARLLLKLEYLNPAGSVKDRAAKFMLEDAEVAGKIKPGATIIEATSGNTGIGLAIMAAAKGYHLILTMPETMSVERRNILKAYGAEIVLTEGAKGMAGAVAKAEELAGKIPGSFIAAQFDNPSNAKAHWETTGPEIWQDTDGNVDILVSAVGSGGTITGTGEYLKSVKPEIRVVAVEPAASPVLSGGQAGPHKIQGIGAGFVPTVLNRQVYDQVMRVEDGAAFAAAKLRSCWRRRRESWWESRPVQRFLRPWSWRRCRRMRGRLLWRFCRTAETGIILRNCLDRGRDALAKKGCAAGASF